MPLEPEVHVLSMVRNEAGRFWRSALEAWSTFATTIFVWDDASSDDTRDVAEEFPKTCVVEAEGLTRAWGNESHLRQVSFEETWSRIPIGSWLFVLDADMTPARDPRSLLQPETDAVAFNLYDLWSIETSRLYYRKDRFWRGHLSPRVWLVKKTPEQEEASKFWKWSPRGVHCGHLPQNFQPKRLMIAPPDYGLLHYAYASQALRNQKHAQYLSIETQLSAFERQHAESILGPGVISTLSFQPKLRLHASAEAF